MRLLRPRIPRNTPEKPLSLVVIDDTVKHELIGFSTVNAVGLRPCLPLRLQFLPGCLNCPL